MDSDLEYSFVFSQKSRRTLYYIINYACKLCLNNNIPLEKVDIITYQLTNAIADGKITRSDIEFDYKKGITNILSIGMSRGGSLVCYK